MKKILIRKPGSYDRLEIVEEAPPKPGTGEVLVRVCAAGVNYADCVVRMGLYASAKEYVGWPITPGFEFSGTVEAVGSGVTKFSVGQEVFGVTRFGAYASHIAVEERLLFALPRQLSLVEAAGFPTVFLTAWYPLYELLKLRPGQSVLVHSAAGGVGGALLQLAKLAGCRTVGVVGASHKVATARSLGADEVIDKSRQDLWQTVHRLQPSGFDVVLDANGPETLRKSYQSLAPAGRLVIYGFHSMLPRQGGRPNWMKLAKDYLKTPRFNPLTLTNDNKSILAFNLSYLFDRTEILHDGMNDLLKWLSEGGIKPLPVKEFAFEQVKDAHRALESGQTVGKLVLRFAQSKT